MTETLVEALARQLCCFDGKCEMRSRVHTCCASEQVGVVSDLLSELDRLGYAVVPKEPTEEMADAGTTAFHAAYTQSPIARAVWSAMLAASPKVGE